MASSSASAPPQDEEPLLATEERERSAEQGNTAPNIRLESEIWELQRKYKNLKYFTYGLASLYTILVLLYIILVFDIIKPKQCYPSAPDPSHANATTTTTTTFPSLDESEAVKYERRSFDVKLRGNRFAGLPRPELDTAWHELFEDIRIRVMPSDLEFYNVTSIALADGSGYAAELGVHHELHCLKKIRHYIYRDHYLTNETESEMKEWPAHVDHCIEHLRQSIMCHADPSLSTFKWLPGDPPHVTAVAKGHHQCVNWERLMKWVRGRSVPIFEDGILVGPHDTLR